MLKKFLQKSVRPLGNLFIFVFAIYCMMSSDLLKFFDQGTAMRDVLEWTAGLESRYFDSRMRENLDRKYRSKEIVVVNIDDSSLARIGVFPLPRTIWADLLKKLDVFGAKVVAFDMMFPEKSPSTEKVNPDLVFAKAIQDFQHDGKHVFVAYNILERILNKKGEPDLGTELERQEMNPSTELLPTAPVELMLDVITSQTLAHLQPMGVLAHTYPIEIFVEHEVHMGFITMAADPDGVFRNYRAITNLDGGYYGSLGYNAYEAWLGKKHFVKVSPGTSNQIRAEIKFEGKDFILNENGEALIRYRGLAEQYPDISLYDVLQAKDSDEELKKAFAGKIVFVGSTAEGAHDLRPTPLDVKTPGMYAHINFTQMLIDKYFFQDESESLKYSILLMVLGALTFLLVHRMENAFADLFTIAAFIGGSYYVDRVYFIPSGYQLKLAYCFFSFFLTYSWNTFLNFYEANKEKRQIRGTFARYVAPTVVEEMLKDPENIQVGGSKKDITCLFSDVRDFTSISEGLSAQDLANMLNQYMTEMTDIVFETKGTLDKYIGDAIVAIWGAPVSIGNHAEHAVTAAIRMAEAMPAVNADFSRRGFPEFKVGIGLNTGECSVGNMGSSRIFSYTALGDNMNLGARLEGLCKYYGTQILISENTLARLHPNSVKTRPIDKVIVKGRQQAVGIFEVITTVHFMHREPELHQFYMTGWQFFTHKNFQGAHDVFAQILTKEPQDKASKRLKDLCEKFLAHPELVTEEFDVTKMTEK